MLRCYAIYNPRVGYCQGMNFIAGFFYTLYQNEGVAFALLATLLEETGVEGFYRDDVPLIKEFIHQTNKLLALYLPLLHARLNRTGLSPAFFSSSWFLTSFCYVLQYSKDGQVPNFLLGLFDQYLFVDYL